MGKQTIFRGSTANDGSGDNLRLGAQKINENFTEVYTALGDGSTLASGTYITTTSTNVLWNKSIDATTNTLTNIPNSALDTIANSKLANSTITIAGDTGSSDTDLGDTITFEGGSGITTTVTADKVSFATDGSIVTETSTDVLTNKTIDGGTNTLQNIENASLTNSSIGIGGVTLNLGDTDPTPALNLTDANSYPTSSLSGTITNTQLAGSISNDKLVNSTIRIGDDTSTNFNVGLGESFEFIGGNGVSTEINNNRMTFSVASLPNASLANSSITLGTDTINLGDTTTSIAGLSLTGSGTVDLTGAGSKIRHDFAGYGALPAFATYPGMYAFDTVGNRPYYSSGSGWVRVLDENASISAHTDVNTTGVADRNILQFSSAQGRFNTVNEACARMTITNGGSSNYLFDGDGFSTQASNPTLYLKKGMKYELTIDASGHPFRIQSTSGTSGTVYNDGVVNNSTADGIIVWTVNMDTPATLYYQCTAHSAMQGTINIT